MKSFQNRMLTIAAVALAAISASAPRASAQAATGSFTLPNEVRWQASTLPAGDYTFRMDSAATPARIVLNGPKGYSFISALVADRGDVSEQSSLTIEHRGSTSIVRELYLGQLGVRLRYYVPKGPKDMELAQGPVTTERILVAMK